MRKTLLSGKQKKRNRGGRNINIRFDYTVDYISSWGGTICNHIQNNKKYNSQNNTLKGNSINFGKIVVG